MHIYISSIYGDRAEDIFGSYLRGYTYKYFLVDDNLDGRRRRGVADTQML